MYRGKVVLAYSGCAGTTACVPCLKREMGFKQVIACEPPDAIYKITKGIRDAPYSCVCEHRF